MYMPSTDTNEATPSLVPKAQGRLTPHRVGILNQFISESVYCRKKILNTLLIKIQQSNRFYWVVSKISLTELTTTPARKRGTFTSLTFFLHSASVCVDSCRLTLDTATFLIK